MNKQMRLSALSDELAQVRTKKKEFPEQIERIVPWGKWISMIKPCDYKGSAKISPMIWKRCCGSILCKESGQAAGAGRASGKKGLLT